MNRDIALSWYAETMDKLPARILGLSPFNIQIIKIAVMFDIEKIREQFPILKTEVYGKPLVYLDNAATAQKPSRVIGAIDRMHTSLNGNIHRAVHYMARECTLEYERARETVRAFLGAGKPSEIVFTSGATQSINTVAWSFGEAFVGPGDHIVVSEMEHHSNIVPWQMLCQRKGAVLDVIPFSDEGLLDMAAFERLLSPRTKLVSVTSASNVLGTQPDIRKIIETAHAAGVPVMIDACQGVVHGPVDVAAIDCDFLAFSGHKLFGPTGTGVLYGKEKWLEQMPPFLGGGDMIATVSFAKTTYAELPLKFEAGTANFIGAVGLAEAIRFVQELDAEAASAHEKRLLDAATEAVMRIPGATVYGRDPHKCPILAFNIEGIHPSDIGLVVDKMGVAVRTGTHCAEPLMSHYGVTGMVRASFAVYNTLQEVELFAAALDRAVAMMR